ncbi:hypothetical protein [Paraburkholderia ferrariae]|uniref:hypothetical protein n=1 Tax=Paraburkholderia ferrariae TaxID=386056 RepID=UPI000489D860|nr:hypothetical protein [Paraburkholderia ferrariae]
MFSTTFGEFKISFDVSRLIQNLAASGQLVHDPDTINYPHLFKKRRFTDEEIAKHQANYQPRPVYGWGSRRSTLDDDEQYAGSYPPPRCVPISGIHRTRSKIELNAIGWRARPVLGKVTQVQPDTWADAETGEILTSTEARKRGAYVADSPSDRAIRIHGLIAASAPTEREFIRYVLKMRNSRGGLLEPLADLLDRWIAYTCACILPNHKARKRKALKAILYKRGILADDQTLTREFQVSSRTTKRERIGEACKATLVLPVRQALRTKQSAPIIA